MRPIRVLAADDSSLVRRLLVDALRAEPLLELVGTAATGRIALSKLGLLAPDVVVLDIEMPELDGLATLSELRRTHPRLPVVMFSAFTERGAAATLDALAAGATDYVTKPHAAGGADVAIRSIRDELVPKLLVLGGDAADSAVGASFPAGVGGAAAGAAAGVVARSRTAGNGPVDAVVVGVSTGGPNALAQLVPRLPADLGVPVVVVVHMPPMFSRLLAERLDAGAQVPVAEGSAGAALAPGQVWIAPGGLHLGVRRDGAAVRLTTDDGPLVNACRPSVDVLFAAAAATWGPRVLAVVMTGMGADGLRGCEAIRDAGGQIVVQDAATSVVWGMPGAVAAAGLADRVLPLGGLADEIVRRAAVRRARPAVLGGDRRR